jgi:hypothetical protein
MSASNFTYSATLKTEAICSSETSVSLFELHGVTAQNSVLFCIWLFGYVTEEKALCVGLYWALLKWGSFVMHLSYSDQFLTYSVTSQKLSELRNISSLESMLAAYKIMKYHQMAEFEKRNVWKTYWHAFMILVTGFIEL